MYGNKFIKVQDLYTKNYKMSLKEIFKNLKKEGGSPCFGLEDSIWSDGISPLIDL